MRERRWATVWRFDKEHKGSKSICWKKEELEVEKELH